jgi:Mn2+/Fe2+ NRAMP family transporter
MSAVNAMCARIGMVTGRGLMSALRKKFPRPFLMLVAVLLFVANSVNVGADISGMADAAELLTGLNSHIFAVLFAIGIGWATVQLRYQSIANVLKWLSLVLVAYAFTAFQVGPNWSDVLRASVMPSLPKSREEWSTLVAILGTTISPYLFFWQASLEVEEEKAQGRRTVIDRIGATANEIRLRKIDVGVGTFASNLAMYFIILTTALTLHRQGLTTLTSSAEVAAALKPLVGRFASLLYSLGIIGTGMLAIPTLAGAGAYAFAEVFGWRQGMDERANQAPAFYAVLVLSLTAGVVMDALNINAIRALYWSAVINGLLAPVLLLLILTAASDRTLMRGQPSSLLGRTVVGATTLMMLGAAVAMFVL